MSAFGSSAPTGHRAAPDLPTQSAFGPSGHLGAPTQSGFGTATLGRSRLGVGSLTFFTVGASAPMTVIAGGVTTAFAVTGNVGVPLVYPVLAVALLLFAVGYAAMSRYVVNAGVFYAYISRGLGGIWGTGASFVALLSYSTIQIGLYGLFGVVAQGFFSAHTSLTWHWWVYALAAMAISGILGVLKIDVNAKVLAVLLVVEVLAVIVFTFTGLDHPSGTGGAFAGLSPKNLFTTGLGGAFAFGIASYVGFESAGDYAEEAKDPKRTVGRALYVTILVTGILYTVASWALSVAAGPHEVVAASQAAGPGVVFGIIQTHLGATVANIANVLLMTSVFAAILSFQNTVARYLFAGGRERVLPRVMATTNARNQAPWVGSLTQSIVSLIVVLIFIAKHEDPLTALFTWLSYIAAVGVLLMMWGTSIANLAYLNKHAAEAESLWRRTIAPGLSIIALGVITYVTATNAASLLGLPPGTSSDLEWILPGLVLVAAVLGIAWGAIIRSTNRPVYDGIGKGGPTELLQSV